MLNTNGKLFRKFATRDVFTEYIYSLMKRGERFMVFPDNNQILIDEELDEWNKVNGLLDTTERLLYHKVRDGYVIHCANNPTNILVHIRLLEKNYEDFILQVEEDLNFKME